MTICETIKELFEESKKKDEFEFISTLMNFKGMGSKKGTSNLLEWFDSIEFYEKLYLQNELIPEKARIGLLIYSTFFESSDFLNILGSLARILLGYKSSPYLYFKNVKADRLYGTSEKISMVEEILIDAGFEDVQIFFNQNHFKQIRNTFFHSAYSIDGDNYILHDSDPIVVDGSGRYSVSIADFLLPKIEIVLDFFNCFKNEFVTQKASYISNKIIRGRFPDLMEIQIVGSENGLQGFIAGGSYILLVDDSFWQGMNVRYDLPNQMDSYITDELDRFSKKESIKTNDGKLQNLYDTIIERNKSHELKILALIYRRFAVIIEGYAIAEQNFFKQKDLNYRALSFYEKMCELDSSLSINSNMAATKFLVAEYTNDILKKKESINDLLICLGHEMTISTINNSLLILQNLKSNNVDITKEKGILRQLLTTKETVELQETIEKSMKELESL